MKKRRRWIAVGAVATATVVAVWVAVLVSRARTAPYAFMNGAKLEQVLRGGGSPDMEFAMDFRMPEGYDTVLRKAQRELAASAGWKHWPDQSFPTGARSACFEGRVDMVCIYLEPPRPNDVLITIRRSPTLEDKVVWLMHGAKKVGP